MVTVSRKQSPQSCDLYKVPEAGFGENPHRWMRLDCPLPRVRLNWIEKAGRAKSKSSLRNETVPVGTRIPPSELGITITLL